jgi:hypothetical protein
MVLWGAGNGSNSTFMQLRWGHGLPKPVSFFPNGLSLFYLMLFKNAMEYYLL